MTDEELKHPCRWQDAIQALHAALRTEGPGDPGGVRYALGAMEQHAVESAHKERFIERIPELLSQAVTVWFEIDRARTQAKVDAEAERREKQEPPGE